MLKPRKIDKRAIINLDEDECESTIEKEAASNRKTDFAEDFFSNNSVANDDPQMPVDNISKTETIKEPESLPTSKADDHKATCSECGEQVESKDALADFGWTHITAPNKSEWRCLKCHPFALANHGSDSHTEQAKPVLNNENGVAAKEDVPETPFLRALHFTKNIGSRKDEDFRMSNFKLIRMKSEKTLEATAKKYAEIYTTESAELPRYQLNRAVAKANKFLLTKSREIQ